MQDNTYSPPPPYSTIPTTVMQPPPTPYPNVIPAQLPYDLAATPILKPIIATPCKHF